MTGTQTSQVKAFHFSDALCSYQKYPVFRCRKKPKKPQKLKKFKNTTLQKVFNCSDVL